MHRKPKLLLQLFGVPFQCYKYVVLVLQVRVTVKDVHTYSHTTPLLFVSGAKTKTVL